MAYSDDVNKGFTSLFDFLNSPIQNISQRARHGNLPVDVYVTEDGRYVLKADMPGTSKGERIIKAAPPSRNIPKTNSSTLINASIT